MSQKPQMKPRTSGESTVAARAFSRHDHRRCRREVIKAVEQLCQQRRIRLTPVRRCTLEILLESHHAIGAYDVLAKLGKSGFGETPPQVYRALNFLIEQGFAHKLERLNAYVACSTPTDCCEPCFMVCRNCGRVAEQTIPTASKHLASAAEKLGFSLGTAVIELSGVCSQCPPSS